MSSGPTVALLIIGIFTIIPIIIPIILVIGVIVKFIERQNEKKKEDWDKYKDF
ncbi:MAG: hypothetical protein ACRCXT_08380 [Paraclostridium sp.]